MKVLQQNPSLSQQKLEKERLFVQSIKSFKVPIWFERSCKITEGKLYINRYIYYFSKDSLGQNASEKIIDISIRMGMPDTLLDSFQKILPDLSFIHFGFEERENTCGYKIYGEYVMERKAIQNIKEPFIGALGFKWDAFHPSKQVITKYECVPKQSLENIHERIADIFNKQVHQLLIEASMDIMKYALEKIALKNIIYLEASDGNGPRRSFDINVYDARLSIKDIIQPIRKIFHYFSIPDVIYEKVYNPKNTYSFGHISGGIDVDGKAFVSIYGGLEKQQANTTADGKKK